MFDQILHHWRGFGTVALTVGGSLILGLGAHYLIFGIAGRHAKKTQAILESSLIKHCRAPSKVILPVWTAYFFLPLIEAAPKYVSVLERVLSLALIAAAAWLIINITSVLEDSILNRFKADTANYLRTRKISTQIQVFRKVVSVVVTIIALAIILMSFDKVRSLGASILASAGIAGIILGLAAQRSIGNLIAGIQIAITEPIRIEDVVIAENEWGWIEEINLTYVVVRSWDLRRLIFPVSYFLEKPFQNWTRQSTDLLGNVLIYVDYSVPVQVVREELHRILEESKLWDKHAWALQVTKATEHAVELTALVSAANASNLGDLRCEVREKLIEFIQKNYGSALPRVRAEVLRVGEIAKQDP
jgi:small-conductance mechanosensitive channel